MSYKLFIPGPVAVSEKTLRAMAQPMIGHRSSDFVALYQSLQPDLQALFYTKDPVYLCTTSAWGMMEAAVRNVVKKKVLNCMNGAFSDKWNDVAHRCGKPAGALKFDWGQPVDPEAVRARARHRPVRRRHADPQRDLLRLHDATSPRSWPSCASFPEVISVVDTVSSFSALPIKKDELGIDIMITGTQKALALPPGLSLCSVSKRALDRAATVTERGYYFDLLEFQTNHEKGMTPSTPSHPASSTRSSRSWRTSRPRASSARYARHARLNQHRARLGLRQGLQALSPRRATARSRSTALPTRSTSTCRPCIKVLKSKHGFVIDGGYGKLKGKTFRISNMGDETDETIAVLLGPSTARWRRRPGCRPEGADFDPLRQPDPSRAHAHARGHARGSTKN